MVVPKMWRKVTQLDALRDLRDFTEDVYMTLLRTWSKVNSTGEVKSCNPRPVQALVVSRDIRLGQILCSNISKRRESNPRSIVI